MRTEVIYEDHDLLVCRKPAGLAVESAEIGQMDMVSELKNYLKASSRFDNRILFSSSSGSAATL